MTASPGTQKDQPPFQPGDRVKWCGKPATVTRLHDTAPQIFIRMDQGFFGQEVLIGFDNEGIEHDCQRRKIHISTLLSRSSSTSDLNQ